MRIVFAIWVFLFIITAQSAHAIYDPLSVPNNRVGIHIIDENDLEDAANLVNTNGDWGYVKLVITEENRELKKWQPIFDDMRKKHLIPIVRLATKVENGVWVVPRESEIDNWVTFLNSLNWVTENRYIILFNEPNHAKEWGGEVNPEKYAQILIAFSEKLKAASPDFFILPAGLDASAPNSKDSVDEISFVNRMFTASPSVFTHIDGWNSHSYPNPGFSGSPQGTGRGTVRTYEWERAQFAKYGIDKLPIFIGETGWKHTEGVTDRGSLSTDTVTSYFITAFTSVWNDPAIVAVIPFLLNYQADPFAAFSFQKLQEADFHPMYDAIKTMPKNRGAPKQKHVASLHTFGLPETLVTNSVYTLSLDIENKGQSIVSSDEGWKVEFAQLDDFTIYTEHIDHLIPFHLKAVQTFIKTGEKAGERTYLVNLKKGDELIHSVSESVTLVAPPEVMINVKIWPNKTLDSQKVKVLFYDKGERLVNEFSDVLVQNGMATIKNIYNVVPDEKYRIVVILPYYLPRQTITTLSAESTSVSFPSLIPLDANNDGALNFDDIGAFFKNPMAVINRFLVL